MATAEPVSAPMGGDPAGDGEHVSAGGSAQRPGHEDSAPPSQSPTPDVAKQLDAKFRLGFGKGAERGRTEGAQARDAQWLEALGFTSFDEAVEHVGRWREQGEKPQVDIRQTDEYRSLTKEHHSLKAKYEETSKSLDVLRKQADEARLDKLRATALSKGVGRGGQLDAFVRMFGDRVAFDDSRALRVVESAPDGTQFHSDTPVESWVESVLQENKFLLAVDEARRGTNAKLEPVQTPKATGPDYRSFGTRAPKKSQ